MDFGQSGVASDQSVRGGVLSQKSCTDQIGAVPSFPWRRSELSLAPSSRLNPRKKGVGLAGSPGSPHLALESDLTALRPSPNLHLHLHLHLFVHTPPSATSHQAVRTTMHKLQNYAGHARQGWERMQPSLPFSISRSHSDMNSINPPLKRPSAAAANSPGPGPGSTVTLSFNIPFSAHLAGPEVDDVIYGSPGAFLRWTHPEGTSEGTPTHKLPIHANNVEELRLICKRMTETSNGMLVATVVSTEPKPTAGLSRGPLKTVVTNVCLYGDYELVQRMRETLLNSIPICLVGLGANIQGECQADSGSVAKPSTSTTTSSLIPSNKASSRKSSTTLMVLHAKRRRTYFSCTRSMTRKLQA